MARVPFKQVSEFLEQSGLIKEAPLLDFKEARIGVDVKTWMRGLKLPVLESLQPAMGGIPLSFKKAIISSINEWNALSLTPLFVFQGFSSKRTFVSVPSFNESRSLKRRTAWNQYMEGLNRNENMSEVFRDDNLLNFIRSLFPIFIAGDVEYMVAPYLAAPQLAWLNDRKQGLVEAVYGGYDLIPYCSSITKLIVGVDTKNRSCRYVDPQEILQFLGVSDGQLRDIYLLCSVDPKTTFRHNAELVKLHGKGTRVLQSLSSPNLNQYLRSCAIVSYSPILNGTCQCEPFSGDRVPNDLDDLFGPRLPADIYFALSQGIISAQVINPIIQGELVETSPLLDSEEYRDILNALVDLRSRTLALIIYPLHYQIFSLKVKTVRWYDQMDKALIFDPHYKKISALKWNFPVAAFQKEWNRQGATGVDMNFIVKFLLHNKAHKMENTPDKSTVFESKEQLIGQVFLHAFSLLGLTESEFDTNAFMRALSFVSSANQPHALLILQLLRFRHLSGNPFHFKDFDSIPNVTENRDILLISRTLSVLPMNFKEEAAWTATVDFDLLAFNCILKAVNRTFRSLFEMIFLSTLLRTKLKDVAHKEFVSVSQRLPFYQENNTAMGVVVKEFLLKEESAAAINEKYSASCISPVEDLKKGIQFWNEIVLMVKELGSQNLIDSLLVSQFVDADVFFKAKQTSLQ